MDLKKMKSEADLTAEFNKYKQASEAKKKEIRKNEIQKIRDGFKDYFKDNPEFKIIETNENITASYKNTSIILIEDVYANNQDPSMSVNMKIQTADNKTHELRTTVHSNKEIETSKTANSKEEIMKRDLLYHKAFVEGEIQYTFKYILKGSKITFETIKELLDSL